MKWPVAPLGEVAEIFGGSTPRRDEAMYWGAGHYWATPSDLPMPGEGILDLRSTAETITDAGLRSCSTKLLPVGTVLYSTRATIGKLAIAQVPVATNQGFNNFLAGPLLYNRYLAYALQRFTPDIIRLAGSTTFKEVSRSSLRGFRIPIPPLSEQHRIVHILDEVMMLRKTREEADCKVTRILPAIFIEFFGDPTINPMGWEEKSLRNVIATVEAGWSAMSEGRPRRENEFGVLKVSAVTSGTFLADQNKAVAEPPDSRVLITPRRGDLIFSRANTRELVAASCVVEEDHPRLFLSDKLWRLTPREQQASTMFLKELFWRESIRDKFRVSSSGSSGSMLNISQDAMLRTIVPIPPYPLQLKFEEYSWRMMKINSEARNAGAKIELTSATLLQRAFCGQLTVSWRDSHVKELLAEMEEQARCLNLSASNKIEITT
jgi:type I restriction enzyme S subunit